MYDLDALFWACNHFIHVDRANAAIHCAPVRFSPITFRLVALYDLLSGRPSDDTPEFEDVRQHAGAYVPDPGR